ncbi:MAG: DUF6572 domain-containing protein [Gammaproteobacteria bacterium]
MFRRLINAFQRTATANSHEPKWLDAPDRIDMVSARDTKVTCWLIVNYPWSIETTYGKLNEKLNHYVWLITDGQLATDYPAVASKKTVICIESMYPLTDRIARLLPQMKRKLAELGVDLEIMVDGGKGALIPHSVEPEPHGGADALAAVRECSDRQSYNQLWR